MTRLFAEYPDLVKDLEYLDETRYRLLAVKVCRRAIFLNGIQDERIEVILSMLESGASSSEQDRRYLEDLSTEYDELYFRLSEVEAFEHDQLKEDYLDMFRKARAVAAVLFVTDPDPLVAVHEGIYEALASVEDRQEFRLLLAAKYLSESSDSMTET
ncbi:MAG: hypothetical protein LBG99_03310 [Propionibacteriaceae bacterium]|nr:hypothetical protein [Propionibacteriaceae bacterium]